MSGRPWQASCAACPGAGPVAAGARVCVCSLWVKVSPFLTWGERWGPAAVRAVIGGFELFPSHRAAFLPAPSLRKRKEGTEQSSPPGLRRISGFPRPPVEMRFLSPGLRFPGLSGACGAEDSKGGSLGPGSEQAPHFLFCVLPALLSDRLTLPHPRRSSPPEPGSRTPQATPGNAEPCPVCGMLPRVDPGEQSSGGGGVGRGCSWAHRAGSAPR